MGRNIDKERAAIFAGEIFGAWPPAKSDFRHGFKAGRAEELVRPV